MKYFRLISLIAMALSTSRDLFRLTEENALTKFQDFIIIPLSKLCKKLRTSNDSEERREHLVTNLIKPNQFLLLCFVLSVVLSFFFCV